jgi:hypothetical protein
MVMEKSARISGGKILMVIAVFLTAFFFCSGTYAQEMPPRPVTASFLQNLSFGAFAVTPSALGSVVLTATGTRYVQGTGVILVNMGFVYYPAIFGLQGNLGTIIHPLNGPLVTLTGPNGKSMTMQLGDSFPADPIIISVAPPGTMQVYVGGILDVMDINSNPPGFYSGTFSIMFVQE